MNNTLRSIRIFISGLSILLVGGVQAAQVNFSLTGTVTSTTSHCGTDGDGFDIYCERPNDFGLAAGDSITVSGTYDDSLLTGAGSEFVGFGDGTGNSMTLTIGASVYTQTSADGYVDGDWPRVLFSDGGFAGLGYTLYEWFAVYESYGMNFESWEQLDPYEDPYSGWAFYGTWDAESFSATAAVPVPAAVWLFASGLIGLTAASRRKVNR